MTWLCIVRHTNNTLSSLSVPVLAFRFILSSDPYYVLVPSRAVHSLHLHAAHVLLTLNLKTNTSNNNKPFKTILYSVCTFFSPMPFPSYSLALALLLLPMCAFRCAMLCSMQIPALFWSKMVRCRQHRLMWRPKWDFTMVLSGFGDFRICARGTRGGGVCFGRGPIHDPLRSMGGGSFGEGPIHDPWST